MTPSAHEGTTPGGWHPAVDEAFLRRHTGRGIRVAIVDSGIDGAHPDLLGKVRGAVEVVDDQGDLDVRECEGGDEAGHGTACAGIIASIAPDVEFHSVRVLGPNASGSGDLFLAGLEWTVEQGMHLINMSLGTTRGDYAAPLHDLLDRAYRRGSIVVAAANNLPHPSYPSTFSSSLVSVHKCSGSDPFRLHFHHGQVIEVSAPGIDVRAAWPGGGYRRLTGNSFACPHVTGILALLLEAFPQATPFEAKTLLYALARRNAPGP